MPKERFAASRLLTFLYLGFHVLTPGSFRGNEDEIPSYQCVTELAPHFSTVHSIHSIHREGHQVLQCFTKMNALLLELKPCRLDAHSNAMQKTL